MSDVRERLRRAALTFADSLYEIFHADLLAELRAQIEAQVLGASDPPRRGGTPARAAKADASAAAEPWIAKHIGEVVEWVRRHPGAAPAAIERGLGWKRSKLFLALTHATKSGALVKSGASRNVTYTVAGVSAERAPPREAHAGGTVSQRVVAFVRKAGRCRPKDIVIDASPTALFRALAEACEAGELRKIGERPHVEYEAIGGRASAAPPAAGVLGVEARRDALVARIVDFVRSSPRCGRREICAELGLSSSTASWALASAIESGALTTLGNERPLGYVVPGSDAAATEEGVPPVAKTEDALVEEVIAFVHANPACRYRQLAEATGEERGALHAALRAARDRGSVRVEGAKITTRYFPVDPKPKTLAPPPPRARTLPPPPSVVMPPRASVADEAKATALLAELDEALEDGTHEIRLGHVLQAVIAEIRETRPRFADEHPLARRLDGTIRRVTAIRAERALPFVLGLKRDAKANWHLVARDARRRIAAFDADAEVGVTKKKTHRPPPREKSRSAAADAAVELFPNLRALSAGVVLVGGIKKNEIIEHVEEHHGLRVEWAAMQGANARAADHFVERIRHGRVGAVVVLEGLFSHAQVGAIVDACKATGVPFAYGDTAGTASLRGALAELEANVARLTRLHRSHGRRRGEAGPR